LSRFTITAEMSGASSLVPASAWMSDAPHQRLEGLESAVAAPDKPRPISSALASNWVDDLLEDMRLGLVGPR